ncbi:MAG: hypothetical protein EOM67_16800, partial [Spirochaetia bacterium]|nr:hypothetical protein [Spirochaetia bacterium]
MELYYRSGMIKGYHPQYKYCLVVVSDNFKCKQVITGIPTDIRFDKDTFEVMREYLSNPDSSFVMLVPSRLFDVETVFGIMHIAEEPTYLFECEQDYSKVISEAKI